jgi:hypothetical protein
MEKYLPGTKVKEPSMDPGTAGIVVQLSYTNSSMPGSSSGYCKRNTEEKRKRLFSCSHDKKNKILEM